MVSNAFDTMNAADILDVARSWSFWDRPVRDSVPRTVDLPDELRDSRCLVVQGVRSRSPSAADIARGSGNPPSVR